MEMLYGFCNGCYSDGHPFTWQYDSRVRYLVFQIAIYFSKCYVQGVVIMKNSYRSSVVKNIIGNNAHVEAVRDVRATIYCVQNEVVRVCGPWTYGRPPHQGQGKRTDIQKSKASGFTVNVFQ